MPQLIAVAEPAMESGEEGEKRGPTSSSNASQCRGCGIFAPTRMREQAASGRRRQYHDLGAFDLSPALQLAFRDRHQRTEPAEAARTASAPRAASLQAARLRCGNAIGDGLRRCEAPGHLAARPASATRASRTCGGSPGPPRLYPSARLRDREAALLCCSVARRSDMHRESMRRDYTPYSVFNIGRVLQTGLQSLHAARRSEDGAKTPYFTGFFNHTRGESTEASGAWF